MQCVCIIYTMHTMLSYCQPLNTEAHLLWRERERERGGGGEREGGREGEREGGKEGERERERERERETPHHIVPTNLQPDIVWWSDEKKELWLFELTISFETLVEDARRRKTAKYHDLVEAGLAAGYRSKLITVEVGSRGMVDVSDFTALRNVLDASKKEFSAMTTQVICTAILGSFKIWASRNCTT